MSYCGESYVFNLHDIFILLLKDLIFPFIFQLVALTCLRNYPIYPECFFVC